MQKTFLSSLAIVMVYGLIQSSGCALLTVRAIEEAQDALEVKNTMDLTCIRMRSAQQVWKAVLMAAEDLRITVESKDFDGRQGVFKGNTERLEYIRIFVRQIDPTSSTLCVQARTEMLPDSFSGYDFEFAESIVHKTQEKMLQIDSQ